jgi:hypothetical protein
MGAPGCVQATDLARMGPATGVGLSRGGSSNVPSSLDITRSNSATHDSLHGDDQGQGGALGAGEGSAAQNVAANNGGGGGGGGDGGAGGGDGGGGGGGDSGGGAGGNNVRGSSRPAVQSDARI